MYEHVSLWNVSVCTGCSCPNLVPVDQLFPANNNEHLLASQWEEKNTDMGRKQLSTRMMDDANILDENHERRIRGPKLAMILSTDHSSASLAWRPRNSSHRNGSEHTFHYSDNESSSSVLPWVNLPVNHANVDTSTTPLVSPVRECSSITEHSKMAGPDTYYRWKPAYL